jgi:hypothetical protein
MFTVTHRIILPYFSTDCSYLHIFLSSINACVSESYLAKYYWTSLTFRRKYYSVYHTAVYYRFSRLTARFSVKETGNIIQMNVIVSGKRLVLAAVYAYYLVPCNAIMPHIPYIIVKKDGQR